MCGILIAMAALILHIWQAVKLQRLTCENHRLVAQLAAALAGQVTHVDISSIPCRLHPSNHKNRMYVAHCSACGAELCKDLGLSAQKQALKFPTQDCCML